MPQNVGGTDRIARIALGIVLILLPLVTGFAAATPWLWWAALVVGAVMLVTGAARTCPLYSVIGVNTCPHRP
jgi:lysylphosphatidylglycerol synthetase-like protein (DUF2156 family)